MIHYLRLKNCPIFKQLQLEEALLRTDDRNWCIINEGASSAVVMGISGKKEHLVEESRLSMPLIRRFSGGGCVLVDENTLFITFIINESSFPQQIMQWTGDFYRPLLPALEIRENDYVLGDRKFGGNAQYIMKNRWLHHSSLLWDFCPEKMKVLKHPKKQPQYREERSHEAFLCTLKPLFSTREIFWKAFETTLKSKFQVSFIEEHEISSNAPHRKGTAYIC